MYICSNCGTSFDGRVCPNCCTMRPAAAVLGDSGTILRSRQASTVPPEEQAERFAEELEYSRQADAWRKQQQERGEKMRRRAAQLAEAAQRQQEKREKPAELSPEEQRYIRQAEKAASWKRKAPSVRADRPDEVEVEMPEALRRLKIDSKNPDKPAPSGNRPESGSRSPHTAAKQRSAFTDKSQGAGYRPANGKASLCSERLDAAWRLFASREPAPGGNALPRLPDEAQIGNSDALPRPPGSHGSGE